MIELKNLAIGYNKYTVIARDINYTFKDNTIYGILGASGVGKSTLLKTIAGILKPISGQVLKDNKPVKNAGREGIYMMFQNYTCFDWLNCLDNVTIARRIHNSISEEEFNLAKQKLIDVGLEYRMSY
jgi:ABC-type nitrate/sulfonate/bicarbonate transport system ATPase subunit